MSSKTKKLAGDKTREIMEKAIAEKQKLIRESNLYKRVLDAIIAKCNEEAALGSSHILASDVIIPGELGMPDMDYISFICQSSNTWDILTTISNDLEEMGYYIYIYPTGLAISWVNFSQDE